MAANNQNFDASRGSSVYPRNSFDYEDEEDADFAGTFPVSNPVLDGRPRPISGNSVEVAAKLSKSSVRNSATVDISVATNSGHPSPSPSLVSNRDDASQAAENGHANPNEKQTSELQYKSFSAVMHDDGRESYQLESFRESNVSAFEVDVGFDNPSNEKSNNSNHSKS